MRKKNIPFLCILFIHFTGNIGFHGANKGYTSKTVSLSGEGESTDPNGNKILRFLMNIFATIKYLFQLLFGWLL